MPSVWEERVRNRLAVRILAGCLLWMAAGQAPAAGDEHIYIGGSFGTARVDAGPAARDLENDLLALGFGSASVRFDDRSSGFRLLAGFQVNPHFALEGYYANLGKYDLSVQTSGPATSGSGDVKLTGIGVDAVGILPFSASWSGLGRLGLFTWDADSRFTLSGGGASAQDAVTETGTDLKIGLGIEWKVAAAVALRAEAEHYLFDDPVTLLSLGLVYRFE
jgi:OOP family OmpA-OmpF porin